MPQGDLVLGVLLLLMGRRVLAWYERGVTSRLGRIRPRRRITSRWG